MISEIELDARIEAILYYKNEPMSIEKLVSILDCDESSVKDALAKLDERLKGGGLVLLSNDGEYTIGTSPHAAVIIEKMVKEDLARDLGRAPLDTLTIILYYGPVSKSQIDNIRGVNSGFILRNLLIRGLISRDADPKDQRAFLYKPTFELLSHLGIKNLNELPEYEELRRTLGKNLIELNKDETKDQGVDPEA